MTALESNQLFRDVWAQHDGKCTCCKVELVSFGGGAPQISKQKNKPGLPYHHPDQELDWLCVACNRLRDEFSAREVLRPIQLRLRMSGIEGKCTVGKEIFKLGYDRKISTTFDTDRKKVKWLHSSENLQLELSCFNTARNSLSVEEFGLWIDRIKQGLFR
ncbi:hypothetical protein HK100_004811 [Physocladia obscura]|uniref:Uncharacterized protein n=1 Tax=Physocladia obscura TaxID=109957 RepID=A0AAD5SV70_9FUNG|nr:hypothetical protein HK100_004811 [Physocladia obscura]